MRFIETPIFTDRVCRYLRDEEYRTLQLSLVLRPEQGAVIPGGGGLRKVRWGLESRGKRGGLRVIYCWLAADETCYMLYVYAKNEQGELTLKQLRTLARLVLEELR